MKKPIVPIKNIDINENFSKSAKPLSIVEVKNH